MGEGFVQHAGNKMRKKTAKGWDICVQWCDGSSSWEPLAGLKESNPVKIAEYAVTRGINMQPAFAWWVPFTLKKRTSIIVAVNAQCHK
jgi:hypothetical protein